MLMKDIDTSNLGTCAMPRNCTSSPARMQTVQGKATSQTVTRSSCISFECHPDLLLIDELSSEEDFDEDDDEEYDGDDVVDDIFAKLSLKD